VRLQSRDLTKQLDKTEDNIRAFQAYGQSVGEVLKQIDDERFIIKASSGPRYVVGVREKINKEKLTPGTRVALDMQTLTIMRILPREIDPIVFNMLTDGTFFSRYLDRRRSWCVVHRCGRAE